MGVDRGAHEGSLSDKVTAVYVSTCSDELLYYVLATKGCGEMKGRVSLVIEDSIHVERKGSVWGKFAKEMEKRAWIILSADGGDELCAASISKYGGVAQKWRFCREAERERVSIYAVD